MALLRSHARNEVTLINSRVVVQQHAEVFGSLTHAYQHGKHLGPKELVPGSQLVLIVCLARMQAVERAGLRVSRVGLRVKPRNWLAIEPHCDQPWLARMRRSVHHAQAYVGFGSKPRLAHGTGVARIRVVRDHPESNARLRHGGCGGKLGECNRVFRPRSICCVSSAMRRVCDKHRAATGLPTCDRVLRPRASPALLRPTFDRNGAPVSHRNRGDSGRACKKLSKTALLASEFQPSRIHDPRHA